MAVTDELRHRQTECGTGTAPRWIPERGQVVKNAIKKIFSCFSGQQRRRSRHSNSSVYASSDYYQ
uniref:Uncharacterized protein n=1 Tax=Solanum tuberosum TaxID=4113 RepID=M1C355_SOLTU